jgi:hypothetical protein
VLWNLFSILCWLKTGYQPLDKTEKVGLFLWIFPWICFIMTLGCLSWPHHDWIFVLIILSLTSIGLFLWSVQSNGYALYHSSGTHGPLFMKWVFPLTFLLIHSYLFWSEWTHTNYFGNVPVSVILLNEHHPAFSSPLIPSNDSVQPLEFVNERYPSHSYVYESFRRQYQSTAQGIAIFEMFYGRRFGKLTVGTHD